MGKLVLYSYWRSSCSWRVRAALNIKGVDYTIHPVHLVKDGGDQNKSEYRRKNPAGLVPTLCLEDGVELTESMAILEYLEEKYPDPPLLPKNPIERANVRSICMQIVSNIQPVQNLRILQNPVIAEKKFEWANEHITRGFTVLEEMLKKTSGKYAFGDSITFADLCIIPQIYNAQRFKMTQFPTIEKVGQNASELEPMEQAHPGRQPDCPQEEKLP